VSHKRRRVGDAVPPTMSFRFALGILEDMGHEIENMEPIVTQARPDLDYDLSDSDNSPRARHRLPLTRNFRHHVPYDNMREFRVDLETEGEPSVHPLSKGVEESFEHPVKFQVVLYRGYAGDVEKETMSLDRTLGFLKSYVDTHPSESDRVQQFLGAIGDELDPLVPDATTLQGMRTRRAKNTEPLEYKILEKISSREGEKPELVDRYFSREAYDMEENTITVDILDGTDLPVRTLMKMVAAQYAAHKLNHCGRWISRNPEEVFLPEDLALIPV